MSEAKTQMPLGEIPSEVLVLLATANIRLIRNNEAVRKMYLHDPVFNKFVDLIEYAATRGQSVTYENFAATMTAVIAVSGKQNIGYVAGDILGINL